MKQLDDNDGYIFSFKCLQIRYIGIYIYINEYNINKYIYTINKSTSVYKW